MTLLSRMQSKSNEKGSVSTHFEEDTLNGQATYLEQTSLSLWLTDVIQHVQ